MEAELRPLSTEELIHQLEAQRAERLEILVHEFIMPQVVGHD